MMILFWCVDTGPLFSLTHGYNPCFASVRLLYTLVPAHHSNTLPLAYRFCAPRFTHMPSPAALQQQLHLVAFNARAASAL